MLFEENISVIIGAPLLNSWLCFFYSLPSCSQLHFKHIPKTLKYITPRGYNTVGKVPQTTEKLLDLLVLLLLYFLHSHCISQLPPWRTRCKTTITLTAPWPWHQSQNSLWKSWLFKKVSSYKHTVLLPVPLNYYFFHPNLQLTIRDKNSVRQL